MFNAETLEIAFGNSLAPWAIAAALAAIFTLLAYRITNPVISGFKKSLLIVLRYIAFLAIILMILEPIAKWVTAREVNPRIAILWDNSRSMALVDRSGDRAMSVAALRDSKIIQKLRNDYPIDDFMFSDSLEALSGDLAFGGEATAMGGAFYSLRDYYSRGDPLGTVILISDGQANYGADPVSASYRMEAPVYAIGIGDPTPPMDIILRQITAQKVAYVDREFPIIAGVSAFGYGGTETSVLLYANGKKIGEQRIILPERGELIDVTFDVLPDTEGVTTYRVTVPELGGELTATNNARSARIKILPSKKRILIVGSSPNWEITFLLRALRADPDIEVLTAFTGKSSPAGQVRMPTSLTDFIQYDAVYIVGAIKEMSAKNLDLVLLDYLKNGGAIGLHLLEDANLGSGNVWKEIFPFLYSSGSHVWTRDRFVPELTVQGLVNPVTRISESSSQPTEAYSKLPPLSGFAMVTGSAPGATSLMNHPRLPEVPIIAIREVGLGRVLLLNGTGFWRWSFVPAGFGMDVMTYHALMSSGAAWLLAAGEGEAFSIESDRPVYRSGENVILTSRLRDDTNNPLDGAQVSARFFREDPDSGEVADTLQLILEERSGGIYTIELPSVGVGNWHAAASMELEDQRIGGATARFLVEPYSLELENVRLNENALRNIAEITDGAFLRAADIDSLPDLIEIEPVLRRENHEKSFWDNIILLIIFVLALCGEWIIRKRSDLP